MNFILVPTIWITAEVSLFLEKKIDAEFTTRSPCMVEKITRIYTLPFRICLILFLTSYGKSYTFKCDNSSTACM